MTWWIDDYNDDHDGYNNYVDYNMLMTLLMTTIGTMMVTTTMVTTMVTTKIIVEWFDLFQHAVHTYYIGNDNKSSPDTISPVRILFKLRILTHVLL